MSTIEKNPLRSDASQSIEWNFKLLGHHELAGFGGMGEGMSIQIAKDGRRIIWLAHESAPKNFTAVDVSDPRKPKIVVQTDLPQNHMRSNSLEVVGDIMAVAYQCQKVGQQRAGFELFDISIPEQPKSIAFVDRSGPHSRGVHQLWFCDGEYVHMASGAADFKSTHPKDDQCYQIFDVRNPSKPDRSRTLVDARHARGRQRAAAGAPQAAALRHGLSRAQHQCLSAAAGSLLSRLYRRRHVHSRHQRQVEDEADLPLGQFTALSRISPTPSCRCSNATCWWSRTSRWSTTPATGRS